MGFKKKNKEAPCKGYTFAICPDKEQEILFAKTFGCCRFIWNRMLAVKDIHWRMCQVNPTSAFFKKEFPWLKEVDSTALCNV